MKKILILESNSSQDLNLKKEIKDLKRIIQRQAKESEFEVEIELGVRPSELQELLLEYKPSIVHFCGHGTGNRGLVFQNDAAGKQLVSTDALSNLFALFKDKVECVVLNACYSEEQAKYIVHHINYVVGMSQEIRDDAAIVFATGFYRALGYGKSIEESYKLGCNAIQLEISNSAISRSRSSTENRKFELLDPVEAVLFPEHLKPILKIKEPLTPIAKNQARGPLEIASDFQQAIKKEIARKRYREQSRNTWENFGTDSATKQPQTQKEYRYHKILLRKVKEFWIEGILETSLHNKALIEFKVKKRADAVQSSVRGLDELPVELDDSFDELLQSKILGQVGTGKTLLILGEPGSGKTITLLTLAQQLVTRSEGDPSLPTPVVFNLSSWATERLTIAEWLVEELQVKYQVSKTLGKTWIEQEELILLLDGLDEVQEKHRNACVRALNKFIDAHGATEIVVSSRVRDYEALSERLKLRTAICIQPLTPQEVYQYLDRVGEQLTGLKMLLQQDDGLEEFAQTPLILSIMSLAYQGYSTKDLLEEFELREEVYENLFNTYIERMLHSQGTTQSYSPDDTKQWLTWLAKCMHKNSQTVFLIEELQPTFLENKTMKICYRFKSVLSIMFLLLLIPGSLTLAFLLAKISNNEISICVIIIFKLCLFGGIFVYLDQGNIQTIEMLKLSNLSWIKAKKAFFKEFYNSGKKGIISSVISLAPLLLLLLNDIDFYTLIAFIIIFILMDGMTMGFINGLIAALTESVMSEKNKPNQGIILTMKSARLFAVITFIIGAPIIYLALNIINLHPNSLGILLTVNSGILGGLFGGGIACIQHFTLRRMLCRQGYMPWNYARFLDYAADKMLIQKVGGGYIFVHRMLLEHFAQMKLR